MALPETPNPRTNVAIFGGSAAEATEELMRVAEELGRAFAGRGWTVVNGGYGGSMLASARGATQAGGRAIGVTCSAFKSPPNEFITEVVKTDNLFDRLRTLIELSDAYVVLPGSTGTLAELAMVWELVNKRMIPRRPILCWGEYWRQVVRIFDQDTTRDPRINTTGLPDRRVELISFVSTVEEAVRAIEIETAPETPTDGKDTSNPDRRP